MRVTKERREFCNDTIAI
jgi:dynein intermediate chain 3, axonemal